MEFLSAKASQQNQWHSGHPACTKRRSEMLEGFRLETRSVTETNQAALLSDEAHWTKVNSLTYN